MNNQQLREPLLDDVDRQIVAQRNQDLNNIGQDLADLKSTMAEINSLIQEQGEDLNQSEANTGNAAINIEEGITQVKLASEYQSSFRKKVFVIIIIVLIILAIILIIILWKTGVFDKRDGAPVAPPS